MKPTAGGMEDRLEGQMIQDFHVIEVESRASHALDILRSDPERPMVIMNPGGEAATLLLREDAPLLDAGGTRLVRELLGSLPPVVVEPAGFTLGELVQSAEFSAFAFGARGVVVTEDGRLAGVVPVGRIDQYLAAGEFRSGRMRGASSFGAAVSDAELPGKPTTPPIVIHCSQFGHRNELQYIDRRAPMQCVVKQPFPHSLR